MKSFTALLTFVLTCFGASVAHSAVFAYFSFNGNNSAVTAETFPGDPVFSSTGSNVLNNTFADLDDFEAFNGTTYSHSWSRTWNAGSTGNTFTIGFDMTDLVDLKMRADYRGTATLGFTSFSAIEYSLNGTDWFNAISSPTLTHDSVFTTLTTSDLDFSSVSEIEGQSSVLLRFSFPDTPGSSSWRIDNIQLQAEVIPEPGAATLLFAGLGVFLLTRRRVRKI